jgi:hypothetical protein
MKHLDTAPTTARIADIRVGQRHRKDLGDVHQLAQRSDRLFRARGDLKTIALGV